MHICHVNLASGFSGGERQTLNLIRSLAAQGLKQTLIAKAGSRLFDEVASLPVTTRQVNHFLKGHGQGGDWDLIHCHDGKAVYWALLEQLLRKTPYVITRRVDNPLGKGHLTALAYRRAATVACLSRAIESVVKSRVADAQTAIIPSSYSGFAADADAVDAIRQGFPGKVLVGQVGKLLHHKGFHLTIAAARQLKDSHPQVAFLFLGDGPDRQELEAQAAGLDNVHFLGHRQDIGNWLAALDLLVFPSLSEGLGSTILEAMQHGVPVIGSRAGGIVDIIQDRKNGLLVETGSGPALTEALRQLLDDPELGRQLSEAAKQTLDVFAPQRTAQRYTALYGNCLHDEAKRSKD
ncbi:glycosyltransferase family 4 protein [Gallaecimonas sp. GXIMD4217]|uniref:glycosyltransferase family 4 protein n=1 Tax=Gallaecimonas sp. GXIMD4217 TaxID=3131927 RepID=UPI00311B39BD